MELKENKEEAWLSINKKLSDVRESLTQRSIYRVHNRYLHGTNDKAYEPAVVAIGPYHRGSEGLQMMEEHKVRCLKSLHLQTVERCVSAAAEMEVEARGCYAEAISLSAAEFIEMLVLDGCFILHFLKMNTHQDSTTDVLVDPIFKMEWVVKCLQRDLILFENQIPFFVLCKLFDLIEAPNQHGKLVEMFRLFFGLEEIIYSRWDNRSPDEVKHLLHLMHMIRRSQSPASDWLNYYPLERGFRLIPTATELKDANVKFRASESHDLRVFHFDKGQLTISPLSIVDGTEVWFRNYIVYEQYFPDNKPAFMTDYAVVFDCLVNTRRDVEILSECGIIHNTLGDNQQAADIINRLTHSVPLSPKCFTYGDTFQSINAHYNNRWNRARATLSRDYFHSPWAYISFVAAVLLLLLTLAQTIFSALQL